MNILRIKETCIYVTDIQRTKAFYTEILGLPVISIVEGRRIFFRAGDSVLLCFIAEKTLQEKELPPHGAEGPIHFAFEVAGDEYNSALKRVEESCTPILHRHGWKGGLRSFYFHDPDGNVLEIIEEGIWEDQG